MATEVGEARIKLTFDTKSLSASQTEAAGVIESTGNKMGAMWATKMTIVSEAVKTAMNAVVQLGKKVVQVGADFESQMSKVEAISGASGDELVDLGNKAKQMGATTKFTATEAAQAFEYMAMAGWKTGDMLDGVEGIMYLAAAAGEDLGVTSDIVTDALTAMGYSAGDASHFADVMATASSNANTNVSLMGETFKYVAPVAGALGYSIEDTATAIGLMANAGIKGSQAGTALRSILTNLASPTDSMAAAMNELGISLQDEAGNMRSLDDVMGQLRAGFAGLDEAQKAEYAATIAGKYGMSGLLAVVNASEADYKKLTEAVNNSNGAAKQMADTMNKNLKGALTLLNSQWEATLLSLYEGDIPGFFENLAGTLEKAGDLIIQAAPAVAQGVSALITAIATQLPGFLKEIAPPLLNGILDIVLSLAEHLDEIIVGIQDFIFTVVETLIPRLPEILLGLVNGIMDALKALTAPERMQQMMDIMLELLLTIVDVIPDIIVALIDALPEIITNIIGFLTNPETIGKLLAAALKLFGSLLEALPEIGGKLLESAGEIFGGLWENIQNIFSGVGEWFGGVAEGAWTWIQEALSGVGEFFSGLWTGITEIFAGVGEWFGGVVQGAWDGIQNILAGVGNFFAGIWEGIKKVFSVVVDFFKGIWNGVLNAFETVGNAIRDAFQGVWNFIKNIFETIGNIVKAPINGIISGINGVLSTINSIKIPDWVPIIGGAHTNFGMIPYLANGGFATGMTPAIIGEAGDEVVLPLERNVESWAGPLAQILESELSGGGDGDDEDMTPLVVNLNLDGTQIEQVFLQDVRRAI